MDLEKDQAVIEYFFFGSSKVRHLPSLHPCEGNPLKLYHNPKSERKIGYPSLFEQHGLYSLYGE